MLFFTNHLIHMKIRIKGNSIRYRLSKSEVKKFCDTGHIEESTSFGSNSLVYALQTKDEIAGLSAEFANNQITMFVPASFTRHWDENEITGMDTNCQLPGAGSLFLLLEKDFVCLDHTDEDQSDHYENPNKTC